MLVLVFGRWQLLPCMLLVSLDLNMVATACDRISMFADIMFAFTYALAMPSLPYDATLTVLVAGCCWMPGPGGTRGGVFLLRGSAAGNLLP